MTPRQKRQYLEGLGKTAMAPRKSWLGKAFCLQMFSRGGLNLSLRSGAKMFAEARPRQNLAGIRAGMSSGERTGLIKRSSVLQQR